jgi:hypothetical protein
MGTRQPDVKTEQIALRRPSADVTRRGAVLPSPVGPRAHAGLALLGYLGISVLLFGLPVLAHPGTVFVGMGSSPLSAPATDPGTFMWALTWWPWAVGHQANPFVTHLVWWPHGFNMAWATGVPGVALLLWPVTAAFGPVVSYNVAMLAAPGLAAWTAFLLCRQVTGRLCPSAVGGFVFGFSSYELAHLTAHPNFALVFPLPLVASLVLAHVRGRLSTPAFVGLLTGVLILEFLISAEVFLGLVLFGGFTLLGVLRWSDAGTRARLVATGRWVVAALALTGLVVSPYLAYALAGGVRGIPSSWPSIYSTDLANLVLPTRTAWAGGEALRMTTRHTHAGVGEDGAYFGLLLVVVAGFALSRWGTRTGKLLLGVFGLSVVTSLGPELHVLGQPVVPSVWAPFSRLPLIQDALPSRFIVYAWLAAAVMTAMWLAEARRRLWIRWGTAIVTVALLLPNLQSNLWRNTVDTPAFFISGAYRQYVRPGTSVLAVPFGGNGFSLLWQAQEGLSFPLAGGYLSCQVPKEDQQYPIIRTLVLGHLIPDYGRELQRFLGAHEVGTIVLRDHSPGPWARLFSTLPVRWESVGGVRVYRLSPALLEEYRTLPPDPPSVARQIPRCL